MNSRKFFLIPVLLIITVLFAALTGGCSRTYLGQAAKGHFEIMQSRQPIERILKDQETGDSLRRKLALVMEIRDFATHQLHLPDNKSYRYFAEINRAYPGYNIYAAGTFSVRPRTWCYPLAGCVVYRGYFDREKALRESQKIEAEGYEVYTAPFSGYSTLGIQQDPILSNQLAYDSVRLAGFIFHELAHQQFYYKKSSTVSESFAVTVEQAGVEAWLQAVGTAEQLNRARLAWKQEQDWVDSVLDFRERLDSLYRSDTDQEAMLRAKNDLLDQFSQDHGTDRKLLNNAFFIPYGTYHDLVPEFTTMLDSCSRDFSLFYRMVSDRYR